MILPIFLLIFPSQLVVSDEDVRDFNWIQFLHLVGGLVQFRPGDVTDRDVTFFLHTRSLSGVEIPLGNDTDIDLTKNTKMIIHGWIDNHNRSWYHHLTDAYLKKGDFNVIQVDWGRVALADYISTAYNTRFVGKYVAEFVLNHKLPLEKTHLIGFSFGAHVAGIAGQIIKDQTGTKIRRISGLDPAGTLYRTPLKSERYKLGPEDADVVDVFHSDGGILGYYRPMGTFDVYLNGGTRIQPECRHLSAGNFSTPGAMFEIVYCSHRGSYVRFTEIVDDYKYRCHKCDSLTKYFLGECKSNEDYVFGAEDIDETMTGVCFVWTDKDKTRV